MNCVAFRPQRLRAPSVSNSGRGFTLIEILVVVSIIALLIAILLPSLAQARRQTQVAACSANLRTMGQALVYYVEANNDLIPGAGAGGFENLHKYIQKLSLTAIKFKVHGSGEGLWVDVPWYRCPGDEIHHTTGEVLQKLPDGTEAMVQYALSYGLNTDLSYLLRPDEDNKEHPEGILRKLSTVKRPSSMVSYCGTGNDDINGANRWVLNESNDLMNQTEFEVHHKIGNNFLYSDSHVQFHKVAKNSPPQYGLPPFPWAWLPNYVKGSNPLYEDDWTRQPPINRLP